MVISFWAVIVCAIAAMVLGMVWHSKALFGSRYMKAIGADMNMPPEKMAEINKKMWQLYVTQFILAALQAWILANFLWIGVANAIWIWAGFIMPTLAGQWMWSARPRKDAWTGFLISAGYNLVLFIAFGLILRAWI